MLRGKFKGCRNTAKKRCFGKKVPKVYKIQQIQRELSEVSGYQEQYKVTDGESWKINLHHRRNYENSINDIIFDPFCNSNIKCTQPGSRKVPGRI